MDVSAKKALERNEERGRYRLIGLGEGWIMDEFKKQADRLDDIATNFYKLNCESDFAVINEIKDGIKNWNNKLRNRVYLVSKIFENLKGSESLTKEAVECYLDSNGDM